MVSLIASVLGKLKEFVRQGSTKASLGIHLDSIVTTESLETCGEKGDANITSDTVLPLAESTECITGRDVRVHEGSHLLGSSLLTIHRIVHHHILITEVTL